MDTKVGDKLTARTLTFVETAPGSGVRTATMPDGKSGRTVHLLVKEGRVQLTSTGEDDKSPFKATVDLPAGTDVSAMEWGKVWARITSFAKEVKNVVSGATGGNNNGSNNNNNNNNGNNSNNNSGNVTIYFNIKIW